MWIGHSVLRNAATNPLRLLLSACLGEISQDRPPHGSQCVLAAIPSCALNILLRKIEGKQNEYQVITWVMSESEATEALEHAEEYGFQLQEIILT